MNKTRLLPGSRFLCFNYRAGICGKFGADLELTERFLRMGIDDLSVDPSLILRLRKRVRKIDLQMQGGVGNETGSSCTVV